MGADVGCRASPGFDFNGRSFDNLVTLNPGATNHASMKSANTTTSEGNSFSIEGRRPQDNLFLINGIELTGSPSFPSNQFGKQLTQSRFGGLERPFSQRRCTKHPPPRPAVPHCLPIADSPSSPDRHAADTAFPD